MKYLIEKKLVNDSSEDVAMFLHAGELLDKSAIGAFLGEGYANFSWLTINFIVEKIITLVYCKILWSCMILLIWI